MGVATPVNSNNNTMSQLFKFQDKQIRVFNTDGTPYFVARDVCICLDLEDVHKALDRVDEDDTTSIRVTDAIGREQLTRCVNESGLYALILGSKKPESKAFKKWVTSEVLPSIRATGGYSINPAYQVPKTLSDALRLAADLVDQNERLAAQVQVDAPKVEFYDAVTESPDALDMGTVAKLLGAMGRTSLFAFLRDQKILRENNQPYQTYVDREYFRVAENKFTLPDGTVKISIKTLVLQKGVEYIRGLLKESGHIGQPQLAEAA